METKKIAQLSKQREEELLTEEVGGGGCENKKTASRRDLVHKSGFAGALNSVKKAVGRIVVGHNSGRHRQGTKRTNDDPVISEARKTPATTLC